NNYYSVLYYYSLILFVIMLIKLVLLTYLVSANNIKNSVDFDFLTQSVSRKKIFWSKLKVISLVSLVTISFNSILGSSIAAILVKDLLQSTTIFLINFFGEFLLSIFFVFLFLFITYKFSRIASTMINTLVLVAIPALSLISHISLLSPNNSMEYSDSQKYQYQNIVILDKNKKISQQYIAVKQNYKIQDYTENNISNFGDSITQTNFGSNFNVGDWFFSPFYVIGKNTLDFSKNYNAIDSLNQKGYSGSLVRFRLRQEKVFQQTFTNDLIASNNLGDVNIFELSNDQLVQAIYRALDYIDSSTTTLDIKNQNLVESLLVDLQKNPLWLKDYFSSEEIATVLALYGFAAKECNIFYYIYQEINYVNQFIPNIFSLVSQKYSKALGDLMQYLYFDNKAIWNMDSFQGFITSAEIDKKYGSIKVKDKMSPPLESDIDFVKNTYVKYADNTFKVLSKDYTYQNINLSRFGNIQNQQQWDQYVDSVTTLADLDSISSKIQQTSQNAYIFNTSPNVIDINSYEFFGIPDNVAWISWSDVIFGLYFPVLIVSSYIFWKKSINTNYK
ncbi:MAG: hypothetical protein K2I67_00795, partial [Malacoplasma sp.]|nr:hypothetical protein [Malacoplasma sp.]